MREVWITGIGLVSSLGDGPQAHWDYLRAGGKPVTGPATHLPYAIHPVVDVDYSTHIPRRGDQRQMGPWQRLGVYAAGQALADAGIADDPDLCRRTNMVVAAGGGERDIDVDNQLLASLKTSNTPEAHLNTALMDELRPTLFLAQLPNLLAGNISIVHKITGSSRTFMGEESAAVSAVEVAFARIRAGQGDLALVGGANNADRAELLLLMELAHKLWPGDAAPVWARAAKGGGVVNGSVGCFLVLESREHATARKVRAYARLADIASQRRNWTADTRAPVNPAFTALADNLAPGQLPILSGASGAEPATGDEREFLGQLEQAGHTLAVRATGTMLGHSLEAQFPAGLALAAMALANNAYYPAFDDTGFESPANGPISRALITSWGHWHGQGLALLEQI